MQAFPDTFSLQGLRDNTLQRDTAEAMKRMSELREVVFRNVTRELCQSKKSSIVIPLDDVPIPLRILLIKELCERFPGHIAYHRIVYYSDVDDWNMISDEKNPSGACFEIKIVMDDKEVEYIRVNAAAHCK